MKGALNITIKFMSRANVRLGAIRYGRTMCLACHDDLKAHELTITAAVPRGFIRGLYFYMHDFKRFWEQSTQ